MAGFSRGDGVKLDVELEHALMGGVETKSNQAVARDGRDGDRPFFSSRLITPIWSLKFLGNAVEAERRGRGRLLLPFGICVQDG
jgi:hypothetical protein